MKGLTTFQQEILKTMFEISSGDTVDISQIRKKIKEEPAKISIAISELRQQGLVERKGGPSRWVKITKQAKKITFQTEVNIPEKKKWTIGFNQILGYMLKIASCFLMVVSFWYTYQFFSAKDINQGINIFLSFGIVAGVYVTWTMGTIFWKKRKIECVLLFMTWFFCFIISITSTLASQRITYNIQITDTTEDVILEGIQNQKNMIYSELDLIDNEIDKLKLEQEALSDWKVRKEDYAYNTTNMNRTDKALDRRAELREKMMELSVQESSIITGDTRMDFYSFTAGRFGIQPETLFLIIAILVAIIIDLVGPMFLAASYLWDENQNVRKI